MSPNRDWLQRQLDQRTPPPWQPHEIALGVAGLASWVLVFVELMGWLK